MDISFFSVPRLIGGKRGYLNLPPLPSMFSLFCCVYWAVWAEEEEANPRKREIVFFMI